ncbi:phosphotransferase [Enteractinococcus fodinae]
MKRTVMELAALASAAMPGLDIVEAAAFPDDPRAFDSAIVTDADNNHWRVRSPRNSQAAFRLETEIQVLSGFTPAIRAHLPFRVPSVAGAVQLDSLRTFIYHQMPGKPVDLDTLTRAEDQTIDDIGRIIAAIHKLPSAVVETADLPAYGAEQSRARLLSELDQMALTGKVPSALLRRWENAFEERPMWTFTPRVVHGDFDEASLLIDRNRAVGVTAWTDLHIGDPARDFMWLASTESLEFREAVLSAYHRHMAVPSDHVDLHIMRRAALAAEFSLAKYLMSGIHASDDEVITEAESMLSELAADIDRTGGQDIGQQFWEPSAEVAAEDDVVIASDEEHVPQTVAAREVATPTDTTATAQPSASEDSPEAPAANPVDTQDVTPSPATRDKQEAAEPALPNAADAAASEKSSDSTGEGPETQEHQAQLIVHKLTEDDEVVPQEVAEDEDTQPISWKVVRQNLERD